MEESGMESKECRDSPLKELPTREQKIKRSKDRRDSPTTPPIRLRLKNSTSPLHETEVEKTLSDRSISSSPDSASQDVPHFMTYSYPKHNQREELAPVSPNIFVEMNNNFYEVPYSAQTCSEETQSNDDDSYDQPLDMSKKRSQNEVTSSASNSTYLQQHRPSVITCASALLRTHCSLTDLTHHKCGASGSDSNGTIMDEKNTNYNNCSDSASVYKGPDEIRPGHRREIVSGSCDPVIDEHFRRSLGKEYQQIFSNPSANSVSITVDDHFAKALGDTWLQLQQSKSADTDHPPATQSATKIQSQPPAQFHQHSPEVVST